LGFIHQHNEEKLKQVIFENFSSRELSGMDIASSLASAYLVKLALDGVPPGDYFEKVWQFCSGISEEFDMTIRKIGHVLGWGSETHAMRHLGKGQTNAEIITLALYCVMHYPDDYHTAIQCAPNTVKNNHIIAGITGAVTGTRLGLEAIPEAWYNGLQNRKYILKFSQTLSDIRESHAE
jgi:ADP-ribosylglycohydrolase